MRFTNPPYRFYSNIGIQKLVLRCIYFPLVFKNIRKKQQSQYFGLLVLNKNLGFGHKIQTKDNGSILRTLTFCYSNLAVRISCSSLVIWFAMSDFFSSSSLVLYCVLSSSLLRHLWFSFLSSLVLFTVVELLSPLSVRWWRFSSSHLNGGGVSRHLFCAVVEVILFRPCCF